ncbi:hypothetical protein [Novosphingobium olei]|uniref:Flagellar hook-length control protein FliK n=1 Tax=Novosphingobium olei TaxID=2728851 RepID=A0A7Y0BM75_9SPHN|nr:hypothetical protein [Novosphingobium olei]NML92942.1 hypothetical protein [Novosphingobium olei]
MVEIAANAANTISLGDTLAALTAGTTTNSATASPNSPGFAEALVNAQALNPEGSTGGKGLQDVAARQSLAAAVAATGQLRQSGLELSGAAPARMPSSTIQANATTDDATTDETTDFVQAQLTALPIAGEAAAQLARAILSAPTTTLSAPSATNAAPSGVQTLATTLPPKVTTTVEEAATPSAKGLDTTAIALTMETPLDGQATKAGASATFSATATAPATVTRTITEAEPEAKPGVTAKTFKSAATQTATTTAPSTTSRTGLPEPSREDVPMPAESPASEVIVAAKAIQAEDSAGASPRNTAGSQREDRTATSDKALPARVADAIQSENKPAATSSRLDKAGATRSETQADASATAQTAVAPGTTTPIQTTSNNAQVASALNDQTVQKPVSFGTLVDAIARARTDAEGSAAPIAVALNHTDFGKVSLRFKAEEDGLSVAMSSSDPGFAPAVASASVTAASAGQQASASQQDANRNEATARQSQQSQQAQLADAGAAGTGANGQSQGNAAQAGQGDPRQPATRGTATAGTASPSTRDRATTATPQNNSRHGIFA